jgi:hypothetical protein
MANKLYSRDQNSSRNSATENNKTEAPPSDIANVIGQVKALLQEQAPEKALHAITHSRLKSPWMTNAVGVCHLRLGNTKQAVEFFRSLVVFSAVQLSRDAPLVFKTNYATALLASDNVKGCLAVLNELDDEEHPAVQRLRAAVQRWKQSLSLWHKLQWYLGDPPQRPVTLEFPLGEVD